MYSLGMHTQVLKRLLKGLSFGLVMLLPCVAGATPIFSQLIVFGDSSVDSGYYRALASPGANSIYNSYWAAGVAAGAGAPTSSPGKMYPQVLASYFGLTAESANQPGGTNYATSGAKNVDVNSSAIGGFKSAIPTVNQIATYLSANGNRADPNALYLISSGGNDVGYAEGHTGNGPYPVDPLAYLSNSGASLANAIASLKKGGAKHFVVVNLPTVYAPNVTYNRALFSGLASQNVSVIQADTYSVNLAIYKNPAQYGFTSVSPAAGNTACSPPPGITTAWALLCSSNPNAPSTFVAPNADMTHLYADDEHLATAGQKMVADYVYGLVLNHIGDCFFTWAESSYPTLFVPAGSPSVAASPYYYRFYATTNTYLGISSADNDVYYVSSGNVLNAGPAINWLATSGCN